MNDLAGVVGDKCTTLVPRVSVEPLELARVPGVRGADVGQDELRAALKYDPQTGHFTRLRGSNGHPVGEIAGTVNNNGYRLIRVGNWRRYRAHRLAWLWVHGEWPKGEIDHINGERDDNRLENLRDVPMVMNQQNRRRALKRNQTGMLGVSPTKGRFKAGIYAGRDIHLGVFDTPEEAHEAYLRAKRELHEGCTL